MLRLRASTTSRSAKLCDFILAAGALFSLFTLSYFAYYYAWTGQREFTTWIGGLLYYVLPAVLAVSLFACLRLRETYKIKVALFLLVIVVLIYAGELLARYQASLAAPNPFEGTKSLPRSKTEAVADLHNKGIEAVPAFVVIGLLREQEDGTVKSVVTNKGEEMLPLGGIANKVTAFCGDDEAGEYIVYRSDEHGFVNPPGIWGLERIDVAALGDGFTQGTCVRSDESFVGRIRKHFPATLNLGMAGEAPLSMLAALKEYLPSIRPRVVLWFYFEENDPIELKKEMRTRLLMRYVDSNFKQGLLSRQTEIDRALADWLKNDTAGRSPKQAKKAPTKPITSEDRIVSVLNATAGFIKLGALRPKLGLVFDRHIQLPEFTETTLDLFREIMSQAKATVSTWGGKLYFVYLPSWERYGDPDRASVDRDQVLLMVKTLDVPIIDLHPVFQAHPDPVGLYPFRRWGHYNKEGHKVVAEAVLRFIASTN